jgi:hypothetical protein
LQHHLDRLPKETSLKSLVALLVRFGNGKLGDMPVSQGPIPDSAREVSSLHDLLRITALHNRNPIADFACIAHSAALPGTIN